MKFKKILRAVKSVVLSIFHMDLQIDVEEEENKKEAQANA